MPLKYINMLLVKKLCKIDKKTLEKYAIQCNIKDYPIMSKYDLAVNLEYYWYDIQNTIIPEIEKKKNVSNRTSVTKRMKKWGIQLKKNDIVSILYRLYTFNQHVDLDSIILNLSVIVDSVDTKKSTIKLKLNESLPILVDYYLLNHVNENELLTVKFERTTEYINKNSNEKERIMPGFYGEYCRLMTPYDNNSVYSGFRIKDLESK